MPVIALMLQGRGFGNVPVAQFFQQSQMSQMNSNDVFCHGLSVPQWSLPARCFPMPAGVSSMVQWFK